MSRSNYESARVQRFRPRYRTYPYYLVLVGDLSLYIDPTTAGGLFHLTPYVLAILICHLTYSVGTYFLLEYQVAKRWVPTATTVLDLLFAMGIAYLTEGQTGPSYVFFVFAIIAVGVRATLRTIIRVTLCGVALYLLVISASDGLTGAYVMCAVYLAIAGYLIGFSRSSGPIMKSGCESSKGKRNGNRSRACCTTATCNR